MDTTQEPIDTIAECHLIDAWAKEWQDWYRSHRMVAEIDQPLVTKESRENMHDTTNSVESIEEAKAKEMWIQKAKDHFADTLAEYQYELSGKDFYKAFYQAAYENAESARKEYERSKELVNMLRYHHLGQD